MNNIINFNKGDNGVDKTRNKKINKKKLVIIISICVLLLIVAIIMVIYYASKDARKFLDQYLFRKNVTQEKLESLELDYDSNISIFAYNKYICILAENKLREYSTSGNLENEIDLEINNPVYSVNDNYLAISEANGSKLYLISGNRILWSNDIDGNISRINVNNNGYVSIILTGTTHKSVIVTFDRDGNELFKNYLASTMAIDTSISNNNQYLAFAEVNTSGTAIQSSVRIVSIEKAKNGDPDFTVYNYSANSNKLITGIEDSGNDKVICMYDDEIDVINNSSNNTLINLSEQGKNINFADINLENYVYRAIEESEGLFNTNTVIEMKSTNSDKTVVYTIEGVAKDIHCYKDVIAVNLGQEVDFVNTSGWLLKSYSSTQEVQDITIGNGIAGIIYKDRVELLDL